jgi:hypothetical protein
MLVYQKLSQNCSKEYLQTRGRTLWTGPQPFAMSMQKVAGRLKTEFAPAVGFSLLIIYFRLSPAAVATHRHLHTSDVNNIP